MESLFGMYRIYDRAPSSVARLDNTFIRNKVWITLPSVSDRNLGSGSFSRHGLWETSTLWGMHWERVYARLACTYIGGGSCFISHTAYLVYGEQCTYIDAAFDETEGQAGEPARIKRSAPNRGLHYAGLRGAKRNRGRNQASVNLKMMVHSSLL